MEHFTPPEKQNTVLPETLQLKRLYGEFNRGVIAKMEKLNMEITEEPYDLSEVLRFLEHQKERTEKQLDDRNAMKAQMFAEWLEEQKAKTATETPEEEKTTA